MGTCLHDTSLFFFIIHFYILYFSYFLSYEPHKLWLLEWLSLPQKCCFNIVNMTWLCKNRSIGLNCHIFACSTRQWRNCGRYVWHWDCNAPLTTVSLSLLSDCVVQTEGSEEQWVWYGQRSSPAVSDASGSAIRGADWSSSEPLHQLPALSADPVCSAAVTQHVRRSNTHLHLHTHFYKGFFTSSVNYGELSTNNYNLNTFILNLILVLGQND